MSSKFDEYQTYSANWLNHLKEIETLLQNISATSSTTEKTKLLNAEKEKSPEYVSVLKEILNYTYSPREVFHIKPKNNVFDTNEPCENWVKVLDAIHLLKNDLRGNKALQFYQSFKIMCEQEGRPFEAKLFDLILGKDLKAGIATSTINSVFPNLIPEQPYMRCSLVKQVSPAKWLDPNIKIYTQEKMDGMFANFTVNEDHSVEICSRNGKDFVEKTPFEPLFEAAKHMEPDRQYHGELVVMDKNTGQPLPREIGNGILNSLQKGSKKGNQFDYDNHEINFVVWDSIELAQLNDESVGRIYEERLQITQETIGRAQQNGNHAIRFVETNVFNNLNDAYAQFRQYLMEGKEGACLKLNTMMWSSGTSRDIIKLKNEFSIELKIVGFTEGNGKNADTFGAIQMESADGLLKVDVSGFTDEIRKKISDNREQYLGTIMEVTANGITKTTDTIYSLFLPRFKDFRPDRNEADDLDRIQNSYRESLEAYNPMIELQARHEEQLAKEAAKEAKRLEKANAKKKKTSEVSISPNIKP